MAILHADQTQLSEKLGFNYREAGEVGLLTDTSVAAANTVAGLRTAVNGVTNIHAEFEPYKPRIVRAIDYGEFSAELTDGLINPLTTVVGLVALTLGPNFPANRELMLD